MAFMNKDSTNEPSQKVLPDVSEAVMKTRVELVDRMMDQCSKGVAPWDKAVNPGVGDRLPYTPFSKTATHEAMRGSNGIQLASVAQEKGFKDPRWITRGQMQERGWMFKTGERGTNVEFYTAAGKERTQYKRDSQGNEVFDEDGKRVVEKVMSDKSTIGAVQMFNMEQVVEGKFAKTPIPELDKTPRQPDLKGLDAAFAKSGIEVQDAMEGVPSHSSVRGKGTIYLSQADKSSEVATAQVKVRAMAAKALQLDTAGGWSAADSDRTKAIKTDLRVEMASRILADKYAIPTKGGGQLSELKGHVAQVLNEVGKDGDRGQLRFAGRDADRAVSRVLDGKWERSQERGFVQSAGEKQPDHERQQQRNEQSEHKQEVQAPSKSRSRGKAMERG